MPIAIAALLYGGGFIAQFLYNYETWQAAGGSFGAAPQLPDANFFVCIAAVFRWPTGLHGLGLCIGALAALMFGVLHMGRGEGGVIDKGRNLVYSDKGTYGTAGFVGKRELKWVLDLVPNIRKHPGIILGELDGQVVCVPEKTRFNGNLAVYGASGSKKTRAFCVNMILQSAARKSSLVICDPKSELYEKTSEYLRDQGYTVKVTDVRRGVFFIRLSIGVNAISHDCRDMRMPGRKDTVSFTVTRLDEKNGVAIGIINRIIKQNL